MTTPTFALRVAQSRQRVAEVLDRTYKRDSDGRFGSGSGGVRQSLQDAATPEAVAGVLKSEVQGILGHDVRVDLAGLDVEVARVHAEGILRGAEAAPSAGLRVVSTFGPGSTFGHNAGFEPTHYAVTVGGSDVYFSTHYGRLDDLSGEMGHSDSTGHLAGTPGDLTRVAVHEFGHVVAGGNPSERAGRAYQIARESTPGTSWPAAHVRKEVSGYAATDSGELFAEAFMDVVSAGSGASALSHQIFNETVPGPQALVPTFLARLAHARARVEIAARTYKRDSDGQFSSGGGGVRDSLAGAKTTAEVASALAGELSAKMGRDVKVDLKGMNIDVAREHAEGILRVAERFPGNELGEVTTFGARGALPKAAMGPSGDAHAVTTPGPNGSGTDRIAFNVSITPAVYRRKLERGKSVPKDPTGVAVHEMGHVVSVHNRSVTDAGQAASRSAAATAEDFFDHIGREVSPYAASSEYELTAEGFADVVLNGSGASRLSHDIHDAVVAANQ